MALVNNIPCQWDNLRLATYDLLLAFPTPLPGITPVHGPETNTDSNQDQGQESAPNPNTDSYAS